VIDDPLDTTDPGCGYWTNTEEAHPGVLTPLGWSVAGTGIEISTRAGLRAVGVLSATEVTPPERPADRAFGVFSGRFAARLDFFVEIGNRLPGTDGPAMVDQIFDFVPPDAVARSDRSRYLAIAARMPVAFATSPRRARQARLEVARWWPGAVVVEPTVGAARQAFAAAYARFLRVGSLDGELLLSSIQPLYEQLTQLAQRAGVPSGPLMSGHGTHEETQLVADIWACSRGRLDFSTLLSRYGYHGPRTGELSAPSWREDPGPLRVAVDRYAAMPDDADPAQAERARAAERQAAEGALLAALPAVGRPAARIVLRLARAYLPMRGKAARTQALDAMRAAARRLGELLPLENPDDVFMLTAEELRTGQPAPEVLEVRRAHYERHLRHRLPRTWRGRPAAVPLDAWVVADELPRWTAVAASDGCVEGPARVIADPDEMDVEPGEVLVAYTTDPSWASVIFAAAALVVDVGGLLSHAAVVARELGVPCVMNTQDGTRRIRTGDFCRVDGTAGTVEVLRRG